MGVEIERKFLVDSKKWSLVKKGKGSLIKQGYLFKSEEKTIRVRVKENKGFITIKGKTTNISRSEYEYEIPVSEASELLNQFCENFIEKHRFEITVGTFKWEVDEFIQPRKGLLLAEIELTNEKETPQLPDWVLEEVSHDPQYYNANMI